jgi:cytochrome c-type biogenesis protein CcmF
MASGLNKRILSVHKDLDTEMFTGADPASHVYLILERPVLMNNYLVTYEGDTINDNTREFEVSFARLDEAGETVERFTVHPSVIFNRNNTKLEASNPSTRRMLHKDIFTYIAALPAEQMDVEAAQAIHDSLEYNAFIVYPGDTIRQEGYQMTVGETTTVPQHPDYGAEPGDLGLQAAVEIRGPDERSVFTAKPLLFLRDGLIYGIPGQVDDLRLRIRIAERTFYRFFPRDDSLNYRIFRMKIGETVRYNGWHMTLLDIDRSGQHPRYQPKTDDVAVNAVLELANGSDTIIARPLMFIRENARGTLRTGLPEKGLFVRFDNIYPQFPEFEIAVATTTPAPVILEVAENVPRTDIIVLQAIVFPGINLFWAGASMMMMGLLLGMWRKLRER